MKKLLTGIVAFTIRVIGIRRGNTLFQYNANGRLIGRGDMSTGKLYNAHGTPHWYCYTVIKMKRTFARAGRDHYSACLRS
jgi:hypothetical protein